MFKTLALLLYMVINELSGYRVPYPQPDIVTLTPAQIQDQSCLVAGCSRKAYYHQGTVFMSDELRPWESIQDRAALLHELVHYSQDVVGRYQHLPPASRWLAREREAMRIEQDYLSKYNMHFRFQVLREGDE